MYQKSNIDLLVVSCDSYSDVWATFFKSFFNYWNDCPLDIYLLTNEKTFDQSPVKTIRVGRDISWSDNLLSGIDQLKKDYVLLLFDDLLLNQKVSTVYFNQLSKWINNHDPNYLRLCISHKPKYFDDLVGRIPNKTPYKTSTMPCIWKRSTLKKILYKRKITILDIGCGKGYLIKLFSDNKSFNCFGIDPNIITRKSGNLSFIKASYDNLNLLKKIYF